MITIDCHNINQALPWMANAAMDHTRKKFQKNRPNHRQFVGPVCLLIRNPYGMMEFSPGAFGNPFEKLRLILSGDNDYEFETWTEEGSVHGMVILNESFNIKKECARGRLADTCFKFLQVAGQTRVESLRIVITQAYFEDEDTILQDVNVNSDLLTIYSTLKIRPPFNVAPVIWGQDLSIYQVDPLAVGYRDSWFRKVAKPMYAAGLACKDRNWDTALEILQQMEDLLDWRVAGEHYVKQQMEKESNGKSN